MEFFEMDVETRRLTTSPEIWIYFVTSVGATILTVVLYYAMARLPALCKQAKGRDNRSGDDHVPRSLRRGYTDIEKNPEISVP
jgi:hypothetical protein